MTIVHINCPRGYYIGQVRLYGHRRWIDVTGRCRTAEAALGRAVACMTGSNDMKRARALFIDASGYYGAHVAMEACR